MPVGMSIQWKPLRDSHYIVASLQPGGGGLRQIFARQSTLREVQALARGTPERAVVGLLLGERLDCSLTLTPYVLIESHVEVTVASLGERAISDAIRALRGQVGRRESPDVLGWYCSGPSADAAVSQTHAAVHAACFAERWQTMLIVGGSTGAFYLYDGSEGRWFHAPFYEIADSKGSSRATRPTCIAWPAYVTTASVIRMAAAPKQVPLPSRQASITTPVPPPARRHSATFARFVVTVRRTPASAVAGVGRIAVAARRSALDIAKAIGGRAITASRHGTRKLGRIRAEWTARTAQRKAEADAARARDEEWRAKQAAERQAALEGAKRRAAEAQKQRAAEVEARRVAEADARRQAAEEADRRRAAEAEARRQAAELEARRQAEAAEEERLRAAEAEAERQAAETEARRLAAEAEARRLAEEAEAEAQRKAAEAEEDASRKAAEAEQEARRRTEEAEALGISLAVAATRRRLARPPVEGSKREASRGAGGQMVDHEDTTASDGPDRYLALAMREGFEVSVQMARGSPADPETFWLLHESESGLRLIIVTTDEVVRRASLHYNLRAEDDALLRSTTPEHRDLETRTIYGREECLHELRARCRRLRATGALERDWKVLPSS